MWILVKSYKVSPGSGTWFFIVAFVLELLIHVSRPEIWSWLMRKSACHFIALMDAQSGCPSWDGVIIWSSRLNARRSETFLRCEAGVEGSIRELLFCLIFTHAIGAKFLLRKVRQSWVYVGRRML